MLIYNQDTKQNKKTGCNMIFKADTKEIIIPKSEYSLVDNIIIESYLSRINNNKYDVIILHKDDVILLKITLKNSLGRA